MLARKRDPILVDTARKGMDTAFIAMLFLVSLTGFALMILRDTSAMGMLLAIHLGVVLGLFLSLPYGKFVHGLYRFLALVKYASERRREVCGVGRFGLLVRSAGEARVSNIQVGYSRLGRVSCRSRGELES